MTKENMVKLNHVNKPTTKNGGLVSALIVYRNESITLESFSPDYACPGKDSWEYFFNKIKKKSILSIFLGTGPECEHKWNPNGSGILWNDYPFPIIFYRNMTVVQNLINYYGKYNADGTYPLVQYQENASKFENL